MTASWRPPDGVAPEQRRPGGPTLASGKPLDAGRAGGRPAGRRAELERIDRLVANALAGRAGALVLEGGSGIGKTTLLEETAARAGDATCLRTRGIESEAALPHACLLELLAPLRRHVADVPPGQAAALSAALGWQTAPATGDPFLVAAGTLSLLAAAAESRPVVVLVDDLQWVDAASRSALLFAARRTHHDRIAFVLAQRPGASHGVEVLAIEELGPPEAVELLAPDVAPAVARALAGAVGGNPLLLLAVAARLAPAERQGTAPLPAVLPLGGALPELVAAELDGLPAGVRAALLLVAAGDGRADQVAAALARSAAGPAALDDVERRGLLVRAGGSLAFRHPLLRTAVWQAATSAERRAAHGALADVARTGDDVRRVWHRAHAKDGRDDALADQLVAVSAAARARHGHGTASLALERAADLTTDAGASVERLAAAVGDAFLSGEVARTRALADRVLHEATGPARAAALLALGRLEEHVGSVPRARDLLAEAAELAEGGDRTEALAELALVQHRLGDAAGMTATAERLAAADDGTPRWTALSSWVRGAALVHVGEPGPGRDLVGRALTLMDTEPSLREDPGLLVHAVLGLGWRGDVLAGAEQVERRIRAARACGARGVLVAGLAMTGHGRAEFLGDHTGAFADAGEAVDLAAQLGYVADAAPAHELLAWEYAARGRHDDAARHLELAGDLVARAGTAQVAAHLALTAAFCALCRGDLGRVVDLLEARLAADGGVGALGEPLGVAPLLVEAYAGSGRRDEARALAARYARVDPGAPPAIAALVARCRALSTDGPGAEAAFQESLRHHADDPHGFEAVRTRLLYGEWLRRTGSRTAAREHLETAAARFRTAGLAHWSARAESELRATGRSARPRRPLPEEPLTPQETRIAVMAAEGATNREIAAALFLSPKTVEHHLSVVYRKRGLRSRTQLARAVPAPGRE